MLQGLGGYWDRASEAAWEENREARGRGASSGGWGRGAGSGRGEGDLVLMEAWVEGRAQSLVVEAENWELERWRTWWKGRSEVRIGIAQEAAEGEAVSDFGA